MKEQSSYRRWILFSYSFISVSLVAGLVYGWPALRQELIQEGSPLNEKALGVVYTVGAWSTQGGRFLTGLARDVFGTRIAACASLVCAAAGSLGVALSSSSNTGALSISLFLVGMGSGLQLCLQPVASLFPKHAGAVLSTLSGAFQISGLVFLALVNISNRRASFLGFTVCLLGLTVIAAILLPKGQSFVIQETCDTDQEAEVESSSSALKDDGGDTHSLDEEASVNDVLQEDCHDNLSSLCHQDETMKEDLASCASPDADHDAERPLEEMSVPDVDPNDEEDPESEQEKREGLDSSCTESVSDSEETPLTALQQIQSWEYIGLLVWFSILVIPLQYYIGTIGFQLEAKGDNGFYSDLFSIIYASAAVIAPAGGYLADTCGLGIAQAVATTLAAVSLLILAVSSLKLQIASLVCYGTGRMLVFGMYFSNVGKRFGYSNYGTLAGLGLLTSAVISLLQYPLIALAVDGHTVAVNVACGAMLLAVTPYCAWLWHQERYYRDRAPSFVKQATVRP